MLRVIDRYLDPSESLLEILFGLIMALTMTAGARLVSDPSAIGQFDLMTALVGCNVAWGVIDAVFYLLGSLFNRSQRVRFVRRLQATTSDEQGMALIRAEFDLGSETPTRPEDRAALYRSLLDLLRHAVPQRARFRRDDLVAAAIVLVLVTAAALPGLLPPAAARRHGHCASSSQCPAGDPAFRNRPPLGPLHRHTRLARRIDRRLARHCPGAGRPGARRLTGPLPWHRLDANVNRGSADCLHG